MRAQCVLVATTLLHSGAKFHSFHYTRSKTVRVNMESCYGGMSTRLKQHAVTEEGDQFLFNIVTGAYKCRPLRRADHYFRESYSVFVCVCVYVYVCVCVCVCMCVSVCVCGV